MIALITVVAALVVWLAFILLRFVVAILRAVLVLLRLVVSLLLTRSLVLIVLLLLFLSLVKAAQISFGKQVGWLGCRFGLTVFQQTQWLLALTVHFDDSLGTLDADGFEVGSKVLVRRVGDKTCQDIHLELMEITVGSLQYGILRRQLSASLYIAVYLVVETALQFGAHTGKFLRIQRNVLIACCIGANADEVLHPGSAAEFSAARTRSTDAACFLSRTDLFHLNAHMEGIGKNLDELAEVYTFVSDVIEDSLVAVSLIFYITYFHLQSEIFGNLAALDHGAVFTALSLLAFVKIHLFGDTVDTLDIILRLEVCLLNLEFYQSSGQRNHTDVVTRVSLYRHYIALLQVEVIHIVVISLTGILELYLHEVSTFSIAGYIGKPVVCVELSVLSSYALSAQTTVAAVTHPEFHIFVIHDRLIYNV